MDGDAAALTIETHIMVREDGWAAPFGRAPDHHVQKAIRRLDVMFLEEIDGTGHLENEVVEPLAKVTLLYHLVTPTEDKLVEPCCQRCWAQGQSPDSLQTHLPVPGSCFASSLLQALRRPVSSISQSLPKRAPPPQPRPHPHYQAPRRIPFLQHGLCHATQKL